MAIGSGSIPAVGSLKPQAIAAAGNATGEWIEASSPYYSAICLVGAGGGIGSAAYTVVQGNTSGGGGAKAVSGITGVTCDTDAQEKSFDIDIASKLDLANGFRWFAIKCVMTGGTNSIAAAVVVATAPLYAT